MKIIHLILGKARLDRTNRINKLAHNPALFHLLESRILKQAHRVHFISTFGIGIISAPIIFMTIFVKDGDAGEVMSMTGRLPFLADLLTYGCTERPIYGFGFMRIHHNFQFYSIHAFPGALTYNTFMQLLLNLGVIGAVICGLQMLFTFGGLIRERDARFRQTFVGVLFGVLVNSLTEFGIFGDANYRIIWWLFMVMFFFMKSVLPLAAHNTQKIITPLPA